jgi:hypothetical protein
MTEEPRDGAGRPAADDARADAVRRHGDGERPRAGEEELFAALERARADLAAAPVPPLPTGFGDRMTAALAAERARRTAGSAPDSTPAVSSPAPRTGAPSRPPSRPEARADDRGGVRPARRRRALACGLVTLAAVAAVVGGLVVGTGTSAGPAPTAAPPVPPVSGPSAAPEPVSGADPVRALRAGLGARDPGPLADPVRRAGCLVAHGLPAGAVPLGSRQVLVDGRPGTLLVLPTGQAARFRLLVVGPGCAPADPETLADLTVGG